MDPLWRFGVIIGNSSEFLTFWGIFRQFWHFGMSFVILIYLGLYWGILDCFGLIFTKFSVILPTSVFWKLFKTEAEVEKYLPNWNEVKHFTHIWNKCIKIFANGVLESPNFCKQFLIQLLNYTLYCVGVPCTCLKNQNKLWWKKEQVLINDSN